MREVHAPFQMAEILHARHDILSGVAPLPETHAAGKIKIHHLRDGHIGHIAVLPQWRKQKVGTAIVEALLDYARTHDYPQISVDAQPCYVPFYRSNGFAEQCEAFKEAGLQRIKMALKLK